MTKTSGISKLYRQATMRKWMMAVVHVSAVFVLGHYVLELDIGTASPWWARYVIIGSIVISWGVVSCFTFFNDSAYDIATSLDPTMNHRLALQWHKGDGGWVQVCVKCGKRFPVPSDFEPPVEIERECDSPLWYGQPSTYTPELDCDKL